LAWHKGWVPLGLWALMRAIELNAGAVEHNKAAFAWGRRAARSAGAVAGLYRPALVVGLPTARPGLAALVARRVDYLTDYQHAAYAQSYADLVARVQQAEARVTGAGKGQDALAQAVAKGLFKLMAYKDEYEVARLHTDAGFHAKVASMFEGDYKLNYHLAPPLLARSNERGELQKRHYGPWMLSAFKLLARLKGLRGTAFDVFGYTAERQSERALISQYRQCIEEVITQLNAHNHSAAVELARIPEHIKGFGHVKERHLAAARPQWTALQQAFRAASEARKLA